MPTPIWWQNKAGGSWDTQSDWNPAVVPDSASANVAISKYGAYTVTEVSSHQVDHLKVKDRKAILQIGDGTTGGTIDVAGLGINNAGSIDIVSPSGSGPASALQFEAGGRIVGAGDIVLEGGTIASLNAGKVTNFDNAITGEGLIGGSGEMTFVNDALVDATTGTLAIDTGTNAITNLWTLEACGSSAQLDLLSALTNGLEGEVLAENGGTVNANTIAVTNHGQIESEGSAGATVSTVLLGNVTNGGAGVLEVDCGGKIEVQGAATNGFALISGAGSLLQLDDGGGADTTLAVYFGGNGFVGEAGGTLALKNSSAFTAWVANFDIGDSIDLLDVAFTGTTKGDHYAASTGVLKITNGTETAKIDLLGSTLGSYMAAFTTAPPAGFTGFVLADDTHGGTLITYARG